MRNFEFDPATGMLRVRGGLEPIIDFPDPVRDIFPVAGGDAALVRAGDYLYRLQDGVVQTLGAVNGDLPGQYEYYGDRGNVGMVFGGNIFLYDNDAISLKKVTSLNCPEAANTIFYTAGRIVVTEVGSDLVRYSGVGDPEQWNDVPENAMTSKSVEVGYQDGCEMIAVGQIVGEMIIFKCPPGQPDNGRIYRLQGNYPNWSIIEQARGASAWNSNAVTVVANNMYFLTRQGLTSLATSMNYGDFQLAWAGQKINPKIKLLLTDNCRLWHMPIRGQVWLWDGHSKDAWIYHYQIGEGAWTAFQFPDVVNAAAAVNERIYVGMGNAVYEINDASTDDNLWDADPSIDDRVPIEALWMPRTLVRPNMLLVKKIRCNYLSTATAEPRVNIEGLIIPLPQSGQGDVAASDEDVAAADTDSLIPSVTQMVRVRCNINKWEVTPRVEVKNGMFSMSSLSLELAEI
jgi:hypothetical protein